MSVKSWSEKAVILKGPAGALDVRLGQHEVSTPSLGEKSGLIMCHPHPLYLGTMDNKVVTTLVRGASRLEIGNEQSLDTIRFNFRGVGESEGEHDQGRGEQDDLAAVVDYAMTELGWQSIYLAGFSFGAGVACLYASNHQKKHPEKIAGLFLIAPAVHHFEAPATLPFEFESHVYMGDADEVVPFDEVEHWVDLLTPQPHFHIFEGASHFFHGRLIDLKKTFLDDLAELTHR
ncbi:MAG: alpha/beta fold hydrolase [Oleispira sp.]|nr:alpha/beta fold hydrolase [Oleispira sp.]MBL4881798.1 alpha/beta fold hydrolase [Oleispira sp.]